jgi:hypothetical protein
VHVRADFDHAGLQHVAALLRGVPSALPWRMNAADYLQSLTVKGASSRIPWSSGAEEINRRGFGAWSAPGRGDESQREA